MSRVGVFVDAGYLFAQGSIALTGAKQERRHADLKQNQLLGLLQSVAFQQSEGRELLRIYWYDGLHRTGPTAQQQNMAGADNVKLRLGLINEYGQQKGVDSLIVTDLVELSRNRAISHALLLAGDEDVRIGVEIAQSLGVRVHLLGIEPSRGSQAKTLLSEVDTKREWSAETVGGFLTFAGFPSSSAAAEPAAEGGRLLEPDPESIFRRVIAELIEECMGDELAACRDALRRSDQVPQPYDGRLLATCRTHLGRDLTGPERSRLRRMFQASAEESVAQESGAGPASPADAATAEMPVTQALAARVEESVSELTEGQIREFHEFWRHSIGVPSDHDRLLLASCREKIGRDLTPEERRFLRKRFQEAVEERFGSS